MRAQDSVANKSLPENSLKSPLSLRSGRSGDAGSSVMGSVKSLMTPASIHSFKSMSSNYSRRPSSRKDFSEAGQKLIQKIMKKR